MGHPVTLQYARKTSFVLTSFRKTRGKSRTVLVVFKSGARAVRFRCELFLEVFSIAHSCLGDALATRAN
jgi:hypothetical protein